MLFYPKKGREAKSGVLRFSWLEDCPVWETATRLNAYLLLISEKPRCDKLREIFIHIRKHKSIREHQQLWVQVR